MERHGPLASLTLAALLALGGCAGSAKTTKAGDLEVTTELDLATTHPREGDLATIAFTIRNNTSNTIILRDLTYLADPALQESASAAASWQVSERGKLTYSAEGNEWKYDLRGGGPKATTAAVFNTGLLVPTESITVRTRLRLLHFPKFFQLLYFELPMENVQMDVYFEARENRDVRYRVLIGDELRGRLLPEKAENRMSHRTVLYPFAERIEPSAKIKPLKVEANLQPREFSLSDAVRKSGGAPPEQYTYFSGLDAWILKRGTQFTLVTAKAATPLPLLRQMERTFYLIDLLGVGKVEVEFLHETKTVFADKYRLVPDGERKRFFTFVDSGRLLEFFKDVREAGLGIDVEFAPEGGGRLQVRR